MKGVLAQRRAGFDLFRRTRKIFRMVRSTVRAFALVCLVGGAVGCGGCNLGEVAIWAFHGDMDTTVPIANEQTTMNDLLACPSPPRRETHWNVIAGGGHVIWDPIYDGSAGFDVYGFLLKNPHP